VAINPSFPRIDLAYRWLVTPSSRGVLGDEQPAPPARPEFLKATGFRPMVEIELTGKVSGLGQLMFLVLPCMSRRLVTRHRDYLALQ
jgi:hypothetical protein